MTIVEIREVVPEDADQRLDRWLRRQFPSLNQIRIEKLCRKGEIRINGCRVKPSKRLISGESVRIPPLYDNKPSVDKPERTFSKSDINMIKECVIFKDKHILVLNKPAGLAVQGGSGQKDRHIDSLIEVLREADMDKPRLVHRLDKDTSGILLLARDRKTAELLTKSFRSKSVRKIYWALVAGIPPSNVGTVRFSLVKRKLSSGNEQMISVLPNEEKDYPDCKRSVTDYVVIEKVSHRATWVGLSPITGRTHQLRSHMSAIGCPIIGDTKYGTRGQVNEGDGWGAQIGGIISRKLHLHARSITFEHPLTKKIIFVEADLPSHMSKAWDTFNWNLKWAPKDPFAIYE
jgi:23S rRNA pseudouridine955/2504/2580 synthase